MTNGMPNKLLHETSPYLRQHAHNPVDWMPWGDEALAKAKAENKLIIVSIGYSACHWCHVMERESFENEAVAQTMNAFYVSIKIDREERPDIDQIYMIALQLMAGTGGWPLNCICLPDGRPIYGGTYFRPQDWQNVLLQVAKMWEETPETAIDYAEKLAAGIREAEKLPILPVPERYTEKNLERIVRPWKAEFDVRNGGYNRAPKFPLPNNWLFWLRYAVLSDDRDALNHVHFTLEKIASGGIYDHIGGGFARYSVDERWHVPHFEKMLYDSAQLIALYSEAHQQRPTPLYERVVSETISWAVREMLGENGGFFAALDADSEGVEGKFYTFLNKELELLDEDADVARRYFNFTEGGNWPEERTNIPFVGPNSEKYIREAGFSDGEWAIRLREIKAKLLAYRSGRIRPARDSKQLTAWNALMIKGLTDAHRVFDRASDLRLAIGTADFILRHCTDGNGHLLHQPADQNRQISGFLDDYAFAIDAFIALYEATFEEHWLEKAGRFAQIALEKFYEEADGAFYYTAKDAEKLIARKSEVMDNVMPSSSSAMVRALCRLGEMTDNRPYTDIADRVFANVFPHMERYGSAYSNWALLLLERVYGNHQIALTGPQALQWRRELDRICYIPNKTLLGGTNGTLPVLRDKPGAEARAYLCKNKTCSLPQNSVAELIALYQEHLEK